MISRNYVFLKNLAASMLLHSAKIYSSSPTQATILLKAATALWTKLDTKRLTEKRMFALIGSLADRIEVGNKKRALISEIARATQALKTSSNSQRSALEQRIKDANNEASDLVEKAKLLDDKITTQGVELKKVLNENYWVNFQEFISLPVDKSTSCVFVSIPREEKEILLTL